VCVHVRRLVGGKQNLDAGIPDNRLEPWREDRVSIKDRETPPRQEALLAVSQIPGHLFHPPRSRVRRRAGDVNATRGDVDHEQHVVSDETANRPHLGREEVRCDDQMCVRPDECRPTHRSIRRGFDPVLLHHAGTPDSIPRIRPF